MAYYPAANDLTKAFNKTIGKLLKKFVAKSQRDWDDKLGECLWAYAQQWESRQKLHHVIGVQV